MFFSSFYDLAQLVSQYLLQTVQSPGKVENTSFTLYYIHNVR